MQLVNHTASQQYAQDELSLVSITHRNRNCNLGMSSLLRGSPQHHDTQPSALEFVTRKRGNPRRTEQSVNTSDVAKSSLVLKLERRRQLAESASPGGTLQAIGVEPAIEHVYPNVLTAASHRSRSNKAPIMQPPAQARTSLWTSCGCVSGS